MPTSNSLLSLVAVNDAASESTAVAVAGIVAFVARSQAHRLAEGSAPLHSNFSPRHADGPDMSMVAIDARYFAALQKATLIEDQIVMGKRYCVAQGLHLVAAFEDGAPTGRHTRRSGLARLKKSRQYGEVDNVIVEALDRLTIRLFDA